MASPFTSLTHIQKITMYVVALLKNERFWLALFDLKKGKANNKNINFGILST